MSHPHLTSSNSAEASFILFFVEKFQDVKLLLQFRWFFSNLWKPISCGRYAVAGSSSDWVVTSIVDSNNHSTTLRDMNKKVKNRQHNLRRRKQLVLMPSSLVLFTYSAYRLVVCLDISPLMFCVRADGSMPISDTLEILTTMIVQTHHSLLSQHSITQVYFSLLAHHARYTHCLFQGCVNKITPVQPIIDQIKRIFTKIEDIIIVRHKFASLMTDLYESNATTQRDQDEYTPSPDRNGNADRVSSGLSTRPSPNYPEHDRSDIQVKFSTTAINAMLSSVSRSDCVSVENICEGINFHVNLLPEEACPIAVILTTGITHFYLFEIIFV